MFQTCQIYHDNPLPAFHHLGCTNPDFTVFERIDVELVSEFVIRGEKPGRQPSGGTMFEASPAPPRCTGSRRRDRIRRDEGTSPRLQTARGLTESEDIETDTTPTLTKTVERESEQRAHRSFLRG